MRSKKVLWAFLIMPLIFNVIPTRVGAQTTTVSIDPQDKTVPNVGMNFTINVNISDVTNFYGYEFKLYYNSTMLNGTQVIEGLFLKSSGDTFFWIVNFTDTYNATHGYVWVTCTLLSEGLGVNGGGVLVTIKFRSMTTGGPYALTLADTKLSDPNSQPISHVTVDGSVTVIPEFPLGIVQLTFMLLIIATLIVFAKRKAAKSKEI